MQVIFETLDIIIAKTKFFGGPMKRVLVFAPHPDDDIIGCGGSIARRVAAGYQVSIVYMTSGEAGGLDIEKKNLLKTREEEARAAANILGVNDLVFLRLPDGYITYGQKELISLTSIIRSQRPDIVYLPHQSDLVPDHTKTFELVWEACRRAETRNFQDSAGDPWIIENILAYEVWQPLDKIGWVEDISRVMSLKMEALKEHVSQLKLMALDEAVQGLNRYRGVMTGKGEYCECFQVLKTKVVW